VAYGLKYELLCTTKKGNLYKVKLNFNNYSSADIDRNIPINPFKLRKDSADVIKGTSLEFSMREEVDFEYLEFYTNDPKNVQVELTDNSDVQLWIGYLDPQQYSCPYIPAPLNITFTASDGLGLLKKEAFTLTGTQTQFAIIRHCLDKISLGLGYAIAIGVHETNHNASLSPLEQTTEPCSTFENFNCYEVIEKILGKYDAEICQWKGRWRIVCSNNKKSTRLLYNSSGTYTGTESYPVVLDLGYAGSGIELTPMGQLNMSLEPGGRQVHAIHDYGRKESLLDNFEFEDFAAGAFDSWNQSGTFDITQGDLNGEKFAFLETTSEVNGDGISQTIAFDNSGGESFILELDYCAIGYLMYIYKRIIAMTCRFQVELTNGVNSYWLKYNGDGAGEWTATPTIISNLNNAAREVPAFNHIKIETAAPPISGYISIDLYRHYGTEPGPNYHYLGVCWSKPIINLIGGAAADAGTKYEATAVFDDSTEPVNLPNISILNADAPAGVPNAGILYRNITKLGSGTPTSLWNIDGVSGDYTAIQVLFKLLASRNRVSRQLLQGTIKGTTIAIDSIIKHAYNNNREFDIIEGTWNIYEETFNGKFLEILAWSDEDITITLGEGISGPGGGSSGGGGSGGGTIIQMTREQILAMLDFLVYHENEGDPYVECTIPFAGDYDIQSYSASGAIPGTIWEDMPVATSGSVGGIILGSGSTLFLREDGTWQAASGGGGMVYPGAGIPVSNGSAWLSSITDNHSNWDAAYGWGNHALAGYALLASKLSAFAATSSAELAGVISDETGNGALMFGTSPTITTSLLIADGAYVGQVSGPKMTFDDTNNYLEISGCYVGIGTTTPLHELDVRGTIVCDGDIIAYHT
jgi:hypothetical protein